MTRSPSIVLSQGFNRHEFGVIFGVNMESREKMSIFSTDFPGVTPIRGYRQDFTDNYSLRHTRFGDQCAQSRFDALYLHDCTQSMSRDTSSLQLDHLHFPPIKYPELEREVAVKFEPTECSSDTLLPNAFSELQQGYRSIKLEPDEFPTVNIRDLGSSVLQLSKDDKTCTDSKESGVSRLQYFQNNPQLPLPLREPLVDMTNALGSLNSIKSPNGSSQSERTYPNRIPISQHLPVLWKAVFDSSNTKSCSIKELDPIVKGSGSLECLTNKIPQIKRSRKLTRPTRSAQRLDPNFRGATVTLHTEVKNRNCSLTLSASFSNVKIYKRQINRKRKNSGSYSNADTVSGSDEENVISFPRDSYYSGKVCASCGTHRTPLWRDADDGTPLCNACGIRFKKYRIRCSACWHIPKKDIKTYPKCPHCGASLRVSFAKRHPW